jgi:hypothetical protein
VAEMGRIAFRSRAPLILAVALLAAKAILWSAFAMVYFVRQGGLAGLPISSIVVTILMAIDALGYILLAWGLARRPRIVFLIASPFLVVNAVLAAGDQFGLFDLIVFFLDLLILGLLLLARRTWPPLTEEA